jgi:predicted DNA-binding transcriptional regulator YafY
VESGVSPTARALLALELIGGSPGITADQLAVRLGVSERAARRYVGILREADIPIDSVRGPYGGYRVGRGLRLPPLVFTATEALGLVMAVLDGHHDASDTTSPVGSGLGKIVRALPGPVAAQAEAVRRATAPAPDRAAARPDPQTTTELVQACSEHRRVRVAYRSEAGLERDFEVDPWAVVVRHGRWYLLCWSHTSNGRRAYRIDRVRAVEVPVDDSSCRLTGTTSNPWWYAEQLTALPAAFRIVGGPELRDAVRVLGQRLLAAAGEEPSGRGSPSTRRRN